LKKAYMFLIVLLVATGSGFSTTHTIVNSGFTFSPSSISISLGDTVKFVLSSNHNAREVDQATWNANGATSNGGFNLPFGGGTVVLSNSGIYYYVCSPHASGGMKGTITVNSTSDVETIGETIPNDFILMQNYPNPFNPATTISFSIPAPSYVSLRVFNLLGKEVAQIISEEMPAGRHSKQWNAADLTSGVYFYRLQSGDFVETKRLMMLK